ncbi:MAG: TlpA family protein disulfide reductase [Janthinobacterium lividum]
MNVIIRLIYTVVLALTLTAQSCAPAQSSARVFTAVIINKSNTKNIAIDYYNDIFINGQNKTIKHNDTLSIAFDTNSFVPVTVFFEARNNSMLSVPLMPGDTVSIAYDEIGDTFNLFGNHAAEYDTYKSFATSRFSTRRLTSPLEFSRKSSFESFLKNWYIIREESELLLTKARQNPAIRQRIKDHLELEIRLQLFILLLQPVTSGEDVDSHQILPASYQNEVNSYAKSLLTVSKPFPAPDVAFALRGYALFLAACEGKSIAEQNTGVEQYWMAKRQFSGWQREWACYSVLRDLFAFNKNLDVAPALLKDYQSWASPDSRFVKQLAEITKLNGGNILSDGSLNDDLLAADGRRVKLFDILSKHKGQVVYLDLWASWCKPCLAEMPASVDLRADYKNRELVVVYLSLDDNDSKWQRAATNSLADAPESYRFSDKGKSGLLKGFKIEAIPRYLLIDKQGVLRYNNAARPSEPNLRKLIDSLL